jgi:methylmalonyl-CoA/ethylmalonyl-CoA epimerase
VPVEALHHVGYVVRSMSSALSRFVDEGATVLVEPIDDPIQRVTVALLSVDGVVPVELVAPTPGLDGPIEARLRRGGGLDHFCYAVPDVAASLAEESERGSIVVCEPVFAVAFASTVGFVQRRSGLVVEYISPMADVPATRTPR